MPSCTCDTCGGPYHWKWEEAFDKFGFGDGDGQIETGAVIDVLEQAGYVAESLQWSLHNEVITSIKKDGVAQIPDDINLGYDDPRNYLPAAIVKLLDEKLPAAEGIRL